MCWKKWHDICLILDLFHREIIGYACGAQKNAALVKQTFSQIPYSLKNVSLFHTHRGKEFDNQMIEELLVTFDITRSMSKKGYPYDHAVAESTYKSLKVESVQQHQFDSLAALELELFDDIHW